MPLPVIFGLCALAVVLISAAAKCCVKIKLALILLASWSVGNVAYSVIGLPHIVVLNSIFDAVLAVMAVNVLNKSEFRVITVGIIGPFLAMMTMHFSYLVFAVDNAYVYHATLNVLYAIQLLTLGASGVADIVKNWLHRIDRSMLDRRAMRDHRG